MNAVIYARYSSDNQREESIEGQLRECLSYAEKNNLKIVNHYIDRAFSARTDDRPAFRQMIQESEKKEFSIILVWKLDRFSRDRYDSAYYKHQLKKNGVRVLSATENISEGPEGIILESMLEGMAEYYSAELAVKVRRRSAGKRSEMPQQRRRIASGVLCQQRPHFRNRSGKSGNCQRNLHKI